MVRLINCYEVPAGPDDEFLSLFQEVNAYMVTKPGHISHRLHRALSADVRYRFVEYVE